MALYTRESKERVRDAVDFVDLVGTRTELRRAGPNRYEGLCPFHDERTPSFGINPAEKLYHCFGCQASGDLFTFVQETEGVDFKGALELLADRYNVALELESEDPREAERRRRRERLLELLARTGGYYERVLWEADEARSAREYLHGRGLGEGSLREFRVGYAPSAWDRVLLASRRAGFTEAELYATGLAQRSQQTAHPYDRFRERIMFPLADVRGRVLGFGARAMRDNQRPKYLNTSDNDVYHKGRHLYGTHLARVAATKGGRVIVCEGYTDVIALHQAGLRETVGLMGTALTEEQLAELARLAPTVLLALDADSAGQEAMLRASRMAARQRLELRVVPLPQGLDPAELVARDGAHAMASVVEASVPFERFQVERVLAQAELGSPEGRDRMLDEVRELFRYVPQGAMREELLRLVSGRVGLREGITESLLAQESRSGAAGASEQAPRRGGGLTDRGERHDQATSSDRRPGPGALGRREETERTFLALCIALPQQGARALDAVDLEQHFTSDAVRRAARHLRAHLQSPGEALPAEDPELAALIAELSVRAGREPARAATLEVESLQLELARVDRQIQAARAEGRGAVAKLAERRGEVKAAVDRAYDRVLEGDG
jgi:DNA primase